MAIAEKIISKVSFSICFHFPTKKQISLHRDHFFCEINFSPRVSSWSDRESTCSKVGILWIILLKSRHSCRVWIARKFLIDMTSTLNDCIIHQCQNDSDTSSETTMSNQSRRCLHVRYCGDVAHNFQLLMVGSFLFACMLGFMTNGCAQFNIGWKWNKNFCVTWNFFSSFISRSLGFPAFFVQKKFNKVFSLKIDRIAKILKYFSGFACLSIDTFSRFIGSSRKILRN